MQIILLENVNKLGKIGESVKVKDGFARNFLIPRSKAVRATKDNLALFEQRKAELEAKNLAAKNAAEAQAKILEGTSVILIRQAGEDGRLYGSVTSKDIANAVTEQVRHQACYTTVILNSKFKELGIYPVTLQLHSEVAAVINLNIARNELEAKAVEAKAKSGGKEPKADAFEAKVAKSKAKNEDLEDEINSAFE